MADAGFLQFLAYFAKLPPSERPSALENIVGVPLGSGVGARRGVNFGYLKFTSESTWNPF